MSTPFTDIYDLNDVVRLDTRLLGKPKNLIYQLYFKYLKYSIMYFADDCYKNLNDYTPFSQVEYEFVGDGINNVFTLDSTPPSIDNFYVSIDGEDTGITFNYNSLTNEITVNPTPNNGSDVYIASYIIGEFTDDLNNTEQIILSEGMNVPWLEQQQNRNDLLNQMVFGTDFKITSQAEHIHQLGVRLDNQYYKVVKAMINSYTWKQNPNSLIGLGGVPSTGGSQL